MILVNGHGFVCRWAEGALLGGGRWTCFVEPPVMGKKRKKSSSSSSEVWCSAVENVSSFES